MHRRFFYFCNVWLRKRETKILRFFFSKFISVCSVKAFQTEKRKLFLPKETTLERADFTVQLLTIVTAEKERKMFTLLFRSIFCQRWP